jgi:polysaccharide pyruvyl transferase WcaK-like protein
LIPPPQCERATSFVSIKYKQAVSDLVRVHEQLFVVWFTRLHAAIAYQTCPFAQAVQQSVLLLHRYVISNNRWLEIFPIEYLGDNGDV